MNVNPIFCTEQEQEAFLLECLDYVSDLIHAFAFQYPGYEFEDLYQIVAVRFLKALPRLEELKTAKSFMYRTAINELSLTVHRSYLRLHQLEEHSFEERIGNGNTNLLLPLTLQSCPRWKVRELYSAMHRLPLDLQQELKERYHLEDFHPWVPTELHGKKGKLQLKNLHRTYYLSKREGEDDSDHERLQKNQKRRVAYHKLRQDPFLQLLQSA